MKPRESQALHFIYNFIVEKGWSPSAQEIIDGLNRKSKCFATQVISALKKEGLVTSAHNRVRTVELTALGLQKIGAGRCPTCGTPYRSETQ